jgi:hypothetical protein
VTSFSFSEIIFFGEAVRNLRGNIGVFSVFDAGFSDDNPVCLNPLARPLLKRRSNRGMVSVDHNPIGS